MILKEDQILNNGTRVYVYDPYIFDQKPRHGKVIGYNATPKKLQQMLGCGNVEYNVKFENGETAWVDSYQILGYLELVYSSDKAA